LKCVFKVKDYDIFFLIQLLPFANSCFYKNLFNVLGTQYYPFVQARGPLSLAVSFRGLPLGFPLALPFPYNQSSKGNAKRKTCPSTAYNTSLSRRCFWNPGLWDSLPLWPQVPFPVPLCKDRWCYCIHPGLLSQCP
jgi:hypothetical protein